MPETAHTITIRTHRAGAQLWYCASALVGHNLLGEGVWRAVVVHTPNRRVVARELRERWGVRVPFRTVRWVDKTNTKQRAAGDLAAWQMATTLFYGGLMEIR